MQAILCFDMDGTLIDQNGRVHPEDIRILADREIPVTFLPATGRPLCSVKRLFARNGLFNDQLLPFPMVLMNGAVLYGPNESLAGFYAFEANIMVTLRELAHRTPEVTFLFLDNQEVHSLWPHPFPIEAARNYDLPLRPLDEDISAGKFAKIMCMSEDHFRLQELFEIVQELPVEQSFSLNTLLEITPKGVDKGSSLKILLEKLKLTGVPVFAAGDSGNDLPLFRVVDQSFAPADSSLTVRQCATHTVDTVKEGILRPMLRAAGVY